MLTVTSKNLDELMAMVRRELGQLPVLRARVDELEADLSAALEAVESGTALPRDVYHRAQEARETHARRTRAKLSKTG